MRFFLVAIVAGAVTVSPLATSARGRRRAPAPAAAPPAEIDPVGGCRANPAVVAACFQVAGRAFRDAKTSVLRIQPDRARKGFPVAPLGAEIIPVCVHDLLQPGVEVHGHFLVCPLTRAARRQLPLVCVEEARELVASRWDPATQQRVPIGGATSCALEAPVE